MEGFAKDRTLMRCCAEHVRNSAAKRIAELVSINRLQSRNLSIRHLHDVVMLPKVGYAGLYEEGKAIDYSYFSCAAPMKDRFSAEAPRNGIPEIKEPVFFLGKFNVCWGHCITDHLKFDLGVCP